MEINYDELQEIGFYEYTSRHYWEMSKEQLAQMLKELSYATRNFCLEVACGNNAIASRYCRKIESEALHELKEFPIQENPYTLCALNSFEEIREWK